jgi:predicted RNase H-like HicB family nuclease
MPELHVIAFTYELVPEKKGYSVNCLDWNCVFTEGETINECKKNAAEVTTMFFKQLLSGELHKSQFPVIKKHQSSALHFQLEFDVHSGKVINLSKINGQKIHVATVDELNLVSA